MKKIVSIRGDKTLEILEIIAKIGTIVFLSASAPNAAGHIIKLLGWMPDYRTNYRAKRVLKNLKDKKLINFWIKDGKGKIVLTKEGKEYLANIRARKIKMPSKQKWDGSWRIVTFDIPEKLKINRRRFATRLKNAGMQNIEESLFIYPHECKKEIIEIAELYGIKKYIKYITASSIEPDFKIKTYFPYTRS